MAVKPITIEEEFAKNPDISPADVAQLRSWLADQPHLPGDHLTDVDLLLVYHCCGWSLQVSKQVLDLHFTLRTLFTQFFKDRAMGKKEEFAFNTILCASLPERTVDGYRVVYGRLLDPDPRNFHFVDVMRTVMMAIDLWQHEEGSWPGFVIIINLDQSVVSHLARLELMAVKKVLYFLQECMLMKLKGVHFMNAPHFMDRLLMLMKPFLKKEMMDLLFVHQVGSDSVYKLVPQRAFPKEDGGDYKDHITLRDEMLDRLHANSEFFKNENKRRVNEALRREKNIAVEQEFGGIQGSFKKLDID